MSTTTQVLKARHWSELGEPTTLVYRKLTKETHPDTNQDPKAVEAFQHLMSLWKDRNTTPKMNITLSARNGFELQRTANGNLLYTVSDKADNDLIIRAENGLTSVRASADPQFFPELQGKRHSPDGRAALQITVPTGNWWLLSDFKELSGRDMVWISKRVLIALVNAHDKDVVHGDVNSSNVLIKPDQHGLVLAGWGGQVQRGDKLVIRPYHQEALLPHRVGSGWFDRRAFALMFEEFNPKEPPLVKFFRAIKDTHCTTREAIQLLNRAAKDAFGEPKFNVLPDPTSPRSLHTRF